MTAFLKLFGIAFVIFLGLDMLWLGVVAKGIYQQQLGHLMRPDTQWIPAILFYVIYVAALVVFVIQPSIDKGSLARAIGLGAFFGLATYAAFDLTSLALLRDFPLKIALIDLAWGATIGATVSAATYLTQR